MVTSNRKQPIPKNPYRFAFTEEDGSDTFEELLPPPEDQENLHNHLLNEVLRMVTFVFGHNDDVARNEARVRRTMTQRDPIERQHDDQYPGPTSRQMFHREDVISLPTVAEDNNAAEDEEEEAADMPQSSEQNETSAEDRAASL